jgi:prepilin-type processing-associated H-X9-DG protein
VGGGRGFPGPRRPRRGLALIEVLVVVATVAILAALFLQSLPRSRETARRADCSSNLRLIGLALQAYEHKNRCFPPGSITFVGDPPRCDEGRRGHGFLTLLLPYIERQAAYNQVNFAFAARGLQGATHAGAINYTALSTPVAAYVCPADSGQTPPPNSMFSKKGETYNAFSHGSYAGAVGTVDIFRWWCNCPPADNDGVVCFGDNTEALPDGAFGFNHGFPVAAFRDGLAETIVVGEFGRFPDDPDPALNVWSFALATASPRVPGVTRPQGLATTVPRINAGLKVPDLPPSAAIRWRYDPANEEMGQFGFRSGHRGGASFLFGDGSVRFLAETIDRRRVYWALGTRDGGVPVAPGSY